MSVIIEWAVGRVLQFQNAMSEAGMLQWAAPLEALLFSKHTLGTLVRKRTGSRGFQAEMFCYKSIEINEMGCKQGPRGTWTISSLQILTPRRP